MQKALIRLPACQEQALLELDTTAFMLEVSFFYKKNPLKASPLFNLSQEVVPTLKIHVLQ